MEELDRQQPSQPPAPPEEAEEGFGLAILLALAATVSGRSRSEGGGGVVRRIGVWQTAVREEVKRLAALVEDVRYVYAVEAAVALRGRRWQRMSCGKALTPSATRRSRRRSPRAFVRQTSADVLTGAFDLTKDPKYHAGDGYDVAARLADVRNQHPELVALDPDATMATGSEDSRHGWRLVAATILAPSPSCAARSPRASRGIARRSRPRASPSWACRRGGGPGGNGGRLGGHRDRAQRFRTVALRAGAGDSGRPRRRARGPPRHAAGRRQPPGGPGHGDRHAARRSGLRGKRRHRDPRHVSVPDRAEDHTPGFRARRRAVRRPRRDRGGRDPAGDGDGGDEGRPTPDDRRRSDEPSTGRYGAPRRPYARRAVPRPSTTWPGPWRS